MCFPGFRNLEPVTTPSDRPQEPDVHAPEAGTAPAGEGAGSGEHQDGGKGGQPEKPRSKKPLIILAVVIVVLAIGALIYWFATRNELTTDDAYIDGNAVTMAPRSPAMS